MCKIRLAQQQQQCMTLSTQQHCRLPITRQAWH
jgi:hypothetical protein